MLFGESTRPLAAGPSVFLPGISRSSHGYPGRPPNVLTLFFCFKNDFFFPNLPSDPTSLDSSLARLNGWTPCRWVGGCGLSGLGLAVSFTRRVSISLHVTHPGRAPSRALTGGSGVVGSLGPGPGELAGAPELGCRSSVGSTPGLGEAQGSRSKRGEGLEVRPWLPAA